MVTTFQDQSCLHCGFVNYAYEPPKPGRSEFTSVKQVARYAGDFPDPEGLTVAVSIDRWGIDGRHEQSGPKVVAQCPWCAEDMTPIVISGGSRQKQKGERRYTCSNRHKIQLIPTGDGGFSWR